MSQSQKLPLKVGDRIKLISGLDKGKESIVLQINKKTGKLIAQNINIKYKHVKPKTPKSIGKLLQFEAPIHHSNVKKFYV